MTAMIRPETRRKVMHLRVVSCNQSLIRRLVCVWAQGPVVTFFIRAGAWNHPQTTRSKDMEKERRAD